jgi:hypothetical protein
VVQEMKELLSSRSLSVTWDDSAFREHVKVIYPYPQLVSEKKPLRRLVASSDRLVRTRPAL